MVIPLSLLLTLIDVVSAVTFPFTVKHTPGHTLHRRADVTAGNTTIAVDNFHNAQYITNITLNGASVRVLLDTGSSDLWVAANIPGAKDSGKAATLGYAIGKASGDIHFANLGFDDYTVNDQAFLLVQDTSTFSTDIHTQGYDGLIGLGPNSGSVLRKEMDKDPKADTVLSRIFFQNKTTSNYISFLLDRKGDPTDPFTGQFTISELVPGFERITSAPKLEVHKVLKFTDENQHWQVLTDKDKGIIGPDGQVIPTKSIVPRAPSGQLVAVVDSGFTFPQVSRKTSDMIYGRVKGAVYDTKSEIWHVPCDQYIPLSFNIGGVNFPIHPLDTVSDDFNLKDANGKKICIGTFQPITSAFSLLGEYDLILGMAFLRNSYTLLDFGDFVTATSATRGDPYIQMIPLTDAATGKEDFIKTRLGGVDTTNDPSKALLPIEQMQHSPQSAEEKKKHYQEKIISRWPYIFVGCLAFLIITVGLCIWKCCCNRGKKAAKKGKGGGGLFQTKQKGVNPSYMPLQEQGGSVRSSAYSHQPPQQSPGYHHV